jgi:hypothetical protein
LISAVCQAQWPFLVSLTDPFDCESLSNALSRVYNALDLPPQTLLLSLLFIILLVSERDVPFLIALMRLFFDRICSLTL